MSYGIGALLFIAGYYVGRWHWKKIADDAAVLAGRAILIFHQIEEEARMPEPAADPTADRLREIQERESKATEGPWEYAVDSCLRCRDEGKEGEYDILQVPSGYHAMLDRKEDADFIAHSRSDIPWLLKLAAELQLDLEPLKRECDRKWENEPRQHIVNIAASALHWRQRENERLESELASAQREGMASLQKWQKENCELTLRAKAAEAALLEARKVDWISVDAEEKPGKSPDPFEEISSEEILLYVPSWAARYRNPVVMGHYMFGSKKFVPSGSHGFEKDVTHWRKKPLPPETGARIKELDGGNG